MLLRVPLVVMQKAIFARLSGDIAPVPVYAYVPDNSAFPLVQIHDFTITDESTKGAGIASVTYMVGIASRETGILELQALIDDVVNSLSRAPFDLEPDGWKHTITRLEFCEAFPPEEGVGEIINVAELRFRFVLTDLQVQ